jgi:putative transposase
MTRPLCSKQNHFPYHVYNRVLDQRFYPDLKVAWDIYADALRLSAWGRGLNVHAFVLMSNHYHLLVSTPDSNLDQCIQYFQSQVSLGMRRYASTGNLRFGTRYKWSLLTDPIYVRSVYRYIYQNPLRAGLVPRVELYPWSTLAGIVGMSALKPPIWDFCKGEVEADLESRLEWLNERPSPDWETYCRQGLRRWEFKLSSRSERLGKKCLGSF